MKKFLCFACAAGGVFFWPLLLVAAWLVIEPFFEDDSEDYLIDE